jgi:hypothetical protein
MLLALLAAFALCASAASAATWQDAGPASGPPFGDGRTTVGWPAGEHHTQVLIGGVPHDVTVFPEYPIVVGAGLLSTGGDLSMRFVDVATGATETIDQPPWQIVGEMEEWSATAIGTRWIQARMTGYHWGQTAWVRRNDHLLRLGSQEEAGPDLAPDLDRPSMYRRLCRGIRRHPPHDSSPSDEDGDKYAPIDYTKPYAVNDGVLQRCGGARIAVPKGATPIVGGGYASWRIHSAVIWLDARGRRHRLRLPFADPPTCTSPVHARAGALVAVPQLWSDCTVREIWTARLPANS